MKDDTGTPAALYTELASWWPLFSHPDDYADEAAWIAKTFTDVLGKYPATVLELGSGGGNIASYLIRHGRMTLVEPSSEMVAVSQQLNPQAEHVVGDMRDIRLGKTFDAVLIHDAIMYMTTQSDLVAALTTARVHLAPGGVLMVLPDHVAETFEPGHDSGGHDARDGSGRGLRYVSWTQPIAPGATTFVVDYAIVLRAEDGSVTVRHDRHTEGLFSCSAWREAFISAGFQPPAVRTDPWNREVHIARTVDRKHLRLDEAWMSHSHASYVDSVPKSYDAFLGPIFFEPNAADLVGRMPALTRGSVLELAAGTGILTRRMRDKLPHDVEIVSTDLNDAMLAHARLKFKEGERVTWAQADATKLPFPETSFEAVVCQFGFMFFPDKRAAFAECFRLLRPGGVLNFSVWDSLEHNDLARLANEAVERHFPVDPPTFYHTPYGYNDTRAIAAALEAAGFEEISHSSVGLVGESPSPRAAATGIVEGTPASIEIRERDPQAIPAIVTALEHDIAASFGAGVVRMKMRAFVFSARRC